MHGALFLERKCNAAGPASVLLSVITFILSPYFKRMAAMWRFLLLKT